MQAFRRVAVGKVKFQLDLFTQMDTGAATIFNNRVDMFGFLVGAAANVDGTPATWFGVWNPFESDCAPLATEANKNPYSQESPRLLAYKMFCTPLYQVAGTNNRLQDAIRHSWHGRLRRGFMIRESEMLYAFIASYHSIATACQDSTIFHWHIGVPHRFLTR